MSGFWTLDVYVLDDAVEALLIQIDMLLDRAAERVLNAPRAGHRSLAYTMEFARRSGRPRSRAERHSDVRAAIACAAGLTVTGERAAIVRSQVPSLAESNHPPARESVDAVHVAGERAVPLFGQERAAAARSIARDRSPIPGVRGEAPPVGGGAISERA